RDQVLHLGVWTDGESLRVDGEEWRDPFSLPLSRENEAYIAQHGHWTLVNLSNEVMFDQLVGRALDKVEPMLHGDKLIGASLFVGATAIDIYVSFDELCTSWGK